jgi:hypothetical protein
MTRRNVSAPGRAAVLLAGVLLMAGIPLSGCGIQLQDEAEPLPIEVIPKAEASPTPTQTARRTTIYYLNGRQLEGVPEAIESRTADGIMGALAAGPPADRQDELSSLLIDPFTGLPLMTVVSVTPSGLVTLARSDAFLGVPAPDQVLLIGQIVMSLDELGMSQVQIVDSFGVPVSISLPDGRTRVGTVIPDDFAELVVTR